MRTTIASLENDTREWLEVDGLGGFASGTVCGIRTRRYHALLLVATRPPAGRIVLVNGFDAWVETRVETFPISSQQYGGEITWPDGHQFLRAFTAEPWPAWEFSLAEDLVVRQELFVPCRVTGIALRWAARGDRAGVRLHVRPFLSGRDYHGLHHENHQFRFAEEATSIPACHSADDRSPSGNVCTRITWQPYAGVPQVHAESNAAYESRPEWYRNFVYQQEQQRGLDFTEDLGSPGEFHWDLETDDAVLLLAAGEPFSNQVGDPGASPPRVFSGAEVAERAQRSAISSIDRSADAYFAQRGDGATIMAGFPWFTDWGRDTFIALRGLCLRPDRLGIARQILLAWAGTVSEGMLPNRFPDHGDLPEYNSVDASLWYVIAVYDYLQSMQRHGGDVAESDRAALMLAVDAILTGYSRGTRYGIRLDDDGLLAAGMPGVQLTWMDAKVGDWVVTPRIGKPVEIQALWLNALWIRSRLRNADSETSGGDSCEFDDTVPLLARKQCHPEASGRNSCEFDDGGGALLRRGQLAFIERFWNDARGYLNDVVDVDHQEGMVDSALRPNQIFSVGGLPLQLLDGERARCVVDVVEGSLLTPLGLRSLDPGHPDYRPSYTGGVWERDGAYHQGTVWPWLIGPFVEAWVRVRGSSSHARREARRRFLDPLQQHLDQAGVGHISEIADAEPPHTPRGCPFQAWSLGEVLRLTNDVLQEDVADEKGTEMV